MKAVWTLELNRRENDRKTIALYVEMKDMMKVLVQYVSKRRLELPVFTHSADYGTLRRTLQTNKILVALA